MHGDCHHRYKYTTYTAVCGLHWRIAMIQLFARLKLKLHLPFVKNKTTEKNANKPDHWRAIFALLVTEKAEQKKMRNNLQLSMLPLLLLLLLIYNRFGIDPRIRREIGKHLSCNFRAQRIIFLSVRMNQALHPCNPSNSNAESEREKYVSVQLKTIYRCEYIL